jgi:hypothetical protein
MAISLSQGAGSGMKIATHAYAAHHGRERDEMSWLPLDKPQQFAIAKIHSHAQRYRVFTHVRVFQHTH